MARKAAPKGAQFWQALRTQLPKSQAQFNPAQSGESSYTYAYLHACSKAGNFVPSWYEFGEKRVQL